MQRKTVTLLMPHAKALSSCASRFLRCFESKVLPKLKVLTVPPSCEELQEAVPSISPAKTVSLPLMT
jgi:hypothetical protein